MADNEKQELSPQDVLFEQVWLPAFTTKCAEHGITFADDEDLAKAVENAFMAKLALDTANTSKSSELHKFANAQLHALLEGKEENTEAPNDKAAEFVEKTGLNEDVVKALMALNKQGSEQEAAE